MTIKFEFEMKFPFQWYITTYKCKVFRAIPLAPLVFPKGNSGKITKNCAHEYQIWIRGYNFLFNDMLHHINVKLLLQFPSPHSCSSPRGIEVQLQKICSKLSILDLGAKFPFQWYITTYKCKTFRVIPHTPFLFFPKRNSNRSVENMLMTIKFEFRMKFRFQRHTVTYKCITVVQFPRPHFWSSPRGKSDKITKKCAHDYKIWIWVEISCPMIYYNV